MATKTYPFTFTTFTGTPTISFLTPYNSPTIHPFAPANNCPSVPEDPYGLEPGCTISNSESVSDHAFWDLYTCCNGAYVQASGGAEMCTGYCTADGQTWQKLMGCLRERVPIVICKPAYDEIARNFTTTVAGTARTTGGTQPKSSGSANGTTRSTRGESTMGVSAFLIVLAVGRAGGMLV